MVENCQNNYNIIFERFSLKFYRFNFHFKNVKVSNKITSVYFFCFYTKYRKQLTSIWDVIKWIFFAIWTKCSNACQPPDFSRSDVVYLGKTQRNPWTRKTLLIAKQWRSAYIVVEWEGALFAINSTTILKGGAKLA